MKTKNLLNGFTRFMFIAAALIFLARLTVAQTWVQQNSNTANTLHSVYFVDNQKGFAAGDLGTLLYTLNGGSSWIPVTGLTNEDLHDVAFSGSTLGIIAGDNGKIFRTTNGGLQWSQVSSGTTVNLQTISFGSGGMVYAAGRDGVIIRSTNNGLNWSTAATGSVRYRGSSAKNTTKSWIVGETGLISVSNNGGTSFTPQTSNTSSDLHNIFMINDLTGYIGGQNSTIIYTSNGGTQWISRNTGINQGIDGIHFSNTNTGWAVGNGGAVYVTFNAGVLWTSENSGIATELNDIYFPDINLGWAVGTGGRIIRRNGTIGIIKLSNNSPADYLLSQNYPNPFNPKTNIEFDIAASGFVSLKVYDITGREIETLVSSNLVSGTYKADWSGAGFPSGVYFYTLKSSDFTQTKRMILIK